MVNNIVTTLFTMLSILTTLLTILLFCHNIVDHVAISHGEGWWWWCYWTYQCWQYDKKIATISVQTDIVQKYISPFDLENMLKLEMFQFVFFCHAKKNKMSLNQKLCWNVLNTFLKVKSRLRVFVVCYFSLMYQLDICWTYLPLPLLW